MEPGIEAYLPSPRIYAPNQSTVGPYTRSSPIEVPSECSPLPRPTPLIPHHFSEWEFSISYIQRPCVFSLTSHPTKPSDSDIWASPICLKTFWMAQYVFILLKFSTTGYWTLYHVEKWNMLAF